MEAGEETSDDATSSSWVTATETDATSYETSYETTEVSTDEATTLMNNNEGCADDFNDNGEISDVSSVSDIDVATDNEDDDSLFSDYLSKFRVRETNFIDEMQRCDSILDEVDQVNKKQYSINDPYIQNLAAEQGIDIMQLKKDVIKDLDKYNFDDEQSELESLHATNESKVFYHREEIVDKDYSRIISEIDEQKNNFNDFVKKIESETILELSNKNQLLVTEYHQKKDNIDSRIESTKTETIKQENYDTKSKLKQLKDESQASVKIQSYFRMYRVRKMYGKVIDDRRAQAKQKLFDDLVVKKEEQIKKGNDEQAAKQLKERKEIARKKIESERIREQRSLNEQKKKDEIQRKLKENIDNIEKKKLEEEENAIKLQQLEEQRSIDEIKTEEERARKIKEANDGISHNKINEAKSAEHEIDKKLYTAAKEEQVSDNGSDAVNGPDAINGSDAVNEPDRNESEDSEPDDLDDVDEAEAELAFQRYQQAITGEIHTSITSAGEIHTCNTSSGEINANNSANFNGSHLPSSHCHLKRTVLRSKALEERANLIKNNVKYIGWSKNHQSLSNILTSLKADLPEVKKPAEVKNIKLEQIVSKERHLDSFDVPTLLKKYDKPINEVERLNEQNIAGEKDLLSLTKFKWLKELTANKCDILSADGIFNLAVLCYLDLDNNKISSLDADGFKSKTLYYVSLANNGLRDINGLQTSTTTLRYANLSHNDITDIDVFSSCKNLHTLIASHNHLADVRVALRRLHSLQRLDLSHNRLRAFPRFHDLPLLSEINLSHNLFDAEPPLTNNVLMRSLDLSHNSLRSIGKSENWCPYLEIMNISNNKLTKLPDTRSYIGLECLDISNNDIEDLNTNHQIKKNYSSLRSLVFKMNPVCGKQFFNRKIMSTFSNVCFLNSIGVRDRDIHEEPTQLYERQSREKFENTIKVDKCNSLEITWNHFAEATSLTALRLSAYEEHRQPDPNDDVWISDLTRDCRQALGLAKVDGEEGGERKEEEKEEGKAGEQEEKDEPGVVGKEEKHAVGGGVKPLTKTTLAKRTSEDNDNKKKTPRHISVESTTKMTSPKRSSVGGDVDKATTPRNTAIKKSTENDASGAKISPSKHYPREKVKEKVEEKAAEVAGDDVKVKTSDSNAASKNALKIKERSDRAAEDRLKRSESVLLKLQQKRLQAIQLKEKRQQQQQQQQGSAMSERELQQMSPRQAVHQQSSPQLLRRTACSTSLDTTPHHPTVVPLVPPVPAATSPPSANSSAAQLDDPSSPSRKALASQTLSPRETKSQRVETLRAKLVDHRSSLLQESRPSNELARQAITSDVVQAAQRSQEPVKQHQDEARVQRPQMSVETIREMARSNQQLKQQMAKFNEFIVRRDIELGVEREPMTRSSLDALKLTTTAATTTASATTAPSSRPHTAHTEPLLLYQRADDEEHSMTMPSTLTSRAPRGAVGGVVVNGRWRPRDASPLRPLSLKLGGGRSPPSGRGEEANRTAARDVVAKARSQTVEKSSARPVEGGGGVGGGVGDGVAGNTFTPDIDEWALLAAPGNEKRAAQMVRDKKNRDRNLTPRMDKPAPNHAPNPAYADELDKSPWHSSDKLSRRPVYSDGQELHASITEQNVRITIDGKEVHNYAEYAEACRKNIPVPSHEEQLKLDDQYQIDIKEKHAQQRREDLLISSSEEDEPSVKQEQQSDTNSDSSYPEIDLTQFDEFLTREEWAPSNDYEKELYNVSPEPPDLPRSVWQKCHSTINTASEKDPNDQEQSIPLSQKIRNDWGFTEDKTTALMMKRSKKFAARRKRKEGKKKQTVFVKSNFTDCMDPDQPMFDVGPEKPSPPRLERHPPDYLRKHLKLPQVVPAVKYFNEKDQVKVENDSRIFEWVHTAVNSQPSITLPELESSIIEGKRPQLTSDRNKPAIRKGLSNKRRTN